MKNKLILGISAPSSTLAKRFIKTNSYKIVTYNKNINDHIAFKKWIKKNKSINCFVNFAAITSSKNSTKSKDYIFQTNYKSVIKIMNIINNANLKNFKYFLSISSSHVFKKTNLKLSEKSVKKPNSIYGMSKLLMEKKIINNQLSYKYSVGIARIFNFYDKKSNKNFFIKDIKEKLKIKDQLIYFNKVNTFRDFIHVEDVISALKHMVKYKLSLDFNICSGKKFNLINIIKYLNKKNKKIIFQKKYFNGIVGSNKKLYNTGWRIKKNVNYKLFD